MNKRELLEAIASLSKQLCEEIQGDYCEDIWGERSTRIELEALLRALDNAQEELKLNTENSGE